MERSQEEYRELFNVSENDNMTPEQYKLPNEVRNSNSKANINLFEFIKQLQSICDVVMPGVQFIPDDKKGIYIQPNAKIDTPFISYKTKSRRSFKERKLMERHEFLEKTDESIEARIGTLFAQRFKCYVQFNIFASGYNIVEEVMDKFEDVIIDYASAFKEAGLVEIFFEEQIEDEKYDSYRQIASVRNLIFFVLFEKQKITYDQVIQSIEPNYISD